MHDAKKTIAYSIAFVCVFVSGFSRGVYLTKAEFQELLNSIKNIESELRKTDVSYSRIEGNLESARGGINVSLERSGEVQKVARQSRYRLPK
jgi:hypothetical protein